MSDFLIKQESLLVVEFQDDAGIPEAISEDNCIETTGDGPTLNCTAESVEYIPHSGDVFKRDKIITLKAGDFSIPVFFKAGSLQGSLPEYHKLLQSLGYKPTGTDGSVSTVAGSTSTTILEIADEFIDRFKENDIVFLKKHGALSGDGVFHVSPIKAVVDGGGEGPSSIELLIPLEVAPLITDSFPIAACQNLALVKGWSKRLTLAEVLQGGQRVKELNNGRVGSMAYQGDATGQLPSLLFSGSSINYNKRIESPALDLLPSYDTSRPAVITESCFFVDGEKFTINDFTYSIERTVTDIKSRCAVNGKIDNLHTGLFNSTGSFNPYLSNSEIEFDLDNKIMSVFTWSGRPAGNGTFKEVCAHFIPRVKAIGIEDGDLDTIQNETINFEGVPEGQLTAPRLAFS